MTEKWNYPSEIKIWTINLRPMRCKRWQTSSVKTRLVVFLFKLKQFKFFDINKAFQGKGN